jgi:hypothetical protein
MAAGAVEPFALFVDMPDRRHVQAPSDQLGPGRLDIGHAQLEALHGARLRLGEALADRDRAGRAGRRQLDDPEVVAGAVVDIEVEAALLHVERLRPVDIGHRDHDQFQREIHDSISLIVRFGQATGTSLAMSSSRR